MAHRREAALGIDLEHRGRGAGHRGPCGAGRDPLADMVHHTGQAEQPVAHLAVAFGAGEIVGYRPGILGIAAIRHERAKHERVNLGRR